MNLISRAARRLALFLPLALLAAPPAPAKPARAVAARAVPAAAARDVPWLYRGSDVPQDREWTFGELGNGLRYAVRHNGVPPGQVSIRIRIDAGSLNERDSERGYAHLIEHLSFRQSRYLAEGAAIPTWQRFGATFGSDTNAETSPTQTVYKLDLPDVSAVNLDESFRLLSGMMAAPTLSEANIRTEVPIVLAEKRERGGAGERVADATRATYYKGQLLGDRPPIGTVDSLENAHQDAVRAFHDRWYRPENTVVVVTGDATPQQLAALVTKYFADWKASGAHLPPPAFGDPVAPAGIDPRNPVGETTVLVEPDLPRVINYAVLRPWRQVHDSIVYNQGLMTDALAQQIINRRLEARARAGGSYLLAQVGQDKVSRSVDGTFVTITPLSNDWRAALRDVRGVIADAMARAPTQEEIDREFAEMQIQYASSVEQRTLMPGAKIADDLITALDIHETVASPETVLNLFKRTKPLFTPAAVLAHSRSLFAGKVIRALAIVPTAAEANGDALRTALREPVVADGSSRLAARTVSFADLPAIGTPQPAIADAPIGLLDIERVDFANGVKAVLWPSKDEPGRVTVKVRFGAGYRGFAPADAPYITLGETALVSSGLGTLGQEDLDRIATGRKMGFDFAVDDTAFVLSANTRAADLNDQLYLFAAKLATPRWDAAPVIRAKAAAAIAYESFETSPSGVLQRDLRYLLADRDPRFRTASPAELAATTPEGFRRVWEPLLRDGPIELQVFGDFDRAATIAALGRTFGALSQRTPLPASTRAAVGAFPAYNAQPLILGHRGDPGQAAAVVSWPTGGGIAGVQESRQLEILTELFNNRLLDALREKLGASYAPQVSSSWPLDLKSGGSLSAVAQLKPEAVPTFFATVDQIAADMIAKPPTADELERVTVPLRQLINRAATSSTFFMTQLEGATSEPERVTSLGTLLADYTVTTPERMQALAARYLLRSKSWRMAVLPQARTGAAAVPPPSATPPR